jgi:hypothetical protein
MAQSVVSGKVTSSEDGSPLPGVSIIIKGSSKGTNTDINGDFKISASSSDILQVSFIGFTTNEVTVGNKTIINISMASDVKSLNEVIVTGFGSQIKRELTGNIAKIKGSDIQDMPIKHIEEVLK